MKDTEPAAKVRIAVTPLSDEDGSSEHTLEAYLRRIEAVGGTCVVLSLHDAPEAALAALTSCDGLLIVGGEDVSPAIYGEAVKPTCQAICKARDQLESALYADARAAEKPILGICRGMQLINALEGGSLYQDLPTERDGGISHSMAAPYDRACHSVTLNGDAPLCGLLGAETLAVNSLHHQAIKALSPMLQAMAISEDGLVEAFCRREGGFVWGVQWHPEMQPMEDEDSRRIFAAFVNACERAKGK